MAISKYLAKEIYTNAMDLDISILKDGFDNYYFKITRGPMHSFRVIAITKPLKYDLGVVCDIIESYLRSISIFGANNCTAKEIQNKNLFTLEFVDKIMIELREKSVVRTYRLKS